MSIVKNHQLVKTSCNHSDQINTGGEKQSPMTLAFPQRKTPGQGCISNHVQDDQTSRSKTDWWKGKTMKIPNDTVDLRHPRSKVTFPVKSCQILLPPAGINFSSELTQDFLGILMIT